MKRIILVLLVFSSLAICHAQDADVPAEIRPSFVISGNFGGDASMFSFGLEKLFFLESNVALAAKVAFGYNQEFTLFESGSPTNYFVLPHSFTINLGGGKRSYGEFGIGGSFITSSHTSRYLVYPILGYRYHPFKNPGFSFKAWFFYPFGQLSKVEDTDALVFPFGISFGIAF